MNGRSGVGVEDVAVAAAAAAVGDIDVVGVVVATVVGGGVSIGTAVAVGIGGTGGVDDIDGAGVGAGIVFAVDGTGFVGDAVGAAAVGVVECVGIAIDGMWGRRGVSKIGGADSSVVEGEGMRNTLKRRR